MGRSARTSPLMSSRLYRSGSGIPVQVVVSLLQLVVVMVVMVLGAQTVVVVLVLVVVLVAVLLLGVAAAEGGVDANLEARPQSGTTASVQVSEYLDGPAR